MDKMVSKIKSLEKKVSGSSSKKKKSKAPTFLRSRSLLTTPRRLPAQEPHRASSFEPREGEDNTQRRRKTSKARRSSSTTGLDRVQTEETQLDRADGVELTWRSPIEDPDSSTIQRLPGLLPDQLDPYNSFEQASSSKAKGATHTLNEEEEEEEPQARSSEVNPVEWSAPDGQPSQAVYHLIAAKFGGANSSSIELGVKTRKVEKLGKTQVEGRVDLEDPLFENPGPQPAERTRPDRKGIGFARPSPGPHRPTREAMDHDRPRSSHHGRPDRATREAKNRARPDLREQEAHLCSFDFSQPN
ncbi:unnamed protein product [Microthlaspi erraticum]|uniref:Uncharacterized protein n=1 Tax=Microthlaspi erraticum TaxID=1685480 RepID=A0A6D2JLJ9_9BRAS|nr:unnamed protein product [Microthlaspi erraticum]